MVNKYERVKDSTGETLKEEFDLGWSNVKFENFGEEVTKLPEMNKDPLSSMIKQEMNSSLSEGNVDPFSSVIKQEIISNLQDVNEDSVGSNIKEVISNLLGVNEDPLGNSIKEEFISNLLGVNEDPLGNSIKEEVISYLQDVNEDPLGSGIKEEVPSDLLGGNEEYLVTTIKEETNCVTPLRRSTRKKPGKFHGDDVSSMEAVQLFDSRCCLAPAAHPFYLRNKYSITTDLRNKKALLNTSNEVWLIHRRFQKFGIAFKQLAVGADVTLAE